MTRELDPVTMTIVEVEDAPAQIIRVEVESDTQAAQVEPQPFTPGNMIMIAKDQVEMKRANASMLLWLDRKLEEEDSEVSELEELLATAKKSKWRTQPFRTQVSKAIQRRDYHFKMREAVAAGYAMVPDMNMTVFAIRRDSPPAYDRSRWAGESTETGESLPIGEGSYVDPHPTRVYCTYDIVGEGVNQKEVSVYKNGDWKGCEFPLAAAKVELMDATNQAMALKLFDEVGIILPVGSGSTKRRAADPMLIGRIRGKHGKNCAFIIAWFLDLRAL